LRWEKRGFGFESFGYLGEISNCVRGGGESNVQKRNICQLSELGVRTFYNANKTVNSNSMKKKKLNKKDEIP